MGARFKSGCYNLQLGSTGPSGCQKQSLASSASPPPCPTRAPAPGRGSSSATRGAPSSIAASSVLALGLPLGLRGASVSIAASVLAFALPLGLLGLPAGRGRVARAAGARASPPATSAP